jgi:fatty acid synthase subunit alpha, fungi type
VQPPTIYAFTGQRSQEQGMEMDLYNTSPATRAVTVWDSADAHFISAYSFSIVDFVRENSKKKTVHFGGIMSQAMPDRYMGMTYDATDKDGNFRSLPLFANINARTLQPTFTHPKGLLLASQFAQIALVIMSCAAEYKFGKKNSCGAA